MNKKAKKSIFVSMIILSILIPLISSLSLFPNPGESSVLIEYTFNFTSSSDCTGVILSNTTIITTNVRGYGFIDINISDIDTIPTYLCEYKDGILRKTHSFSSIIFNTIYARNLNISENIYADGNITSKGWIWADGDITADRGNFNSLNVTGPSYLGNLIINADNITVNNILNQSNDGVRIWSNFYVDGIGIGITSLSAELNIYKEAGSPVIRIETHSDTDGHNSFIDFIKSHTDGSGLVETTDGDILGTIRFRGVDVGSNIDDGAQIKAVQDGVAGGEIPTNLIFSTWSATGENTNQLVLYSDGNTQISNNITAINVFASNILYRNGSATLTGNWNYGGFNFIGDGNFTGNWINSDWVNTTLIYTRFLTAPTIGGTITITGSPLVSNNKITGTAFIIAGDELDTNEWANLDGANQGIATTDQVNFAGVTVDNIDIDGNTITFTGDGNIESSNLMFNFNFANLNEVSKVSGGTGDQDIEFEGPDRIDFTANKIVFGNSIEVEGGGNVNASAFYDDGVLLIDTTCSALGSCSNIIYNNTDGGYNLTVEKLNVDKNANIGGNTILGNDISGTLGIFTQPRTLTSISIGNLTDSTIRWMMDVKLRTSNVAAVALNFYLEETPSVTVGALGSAAVFKVTSDGDPLFGNDMAVVDIRIGGPGTGTTGNVITRGNPEYRGLKVTASNAHATNYPTGGSFDIRVIDVGPPPNNYNFSTAVDYYGLYIEDSSAKYGGNDSYAIYIAGGNSITLGNWTAKNYNDLTPAFSGTPSEALQSVLDIKNTPDGEIDHDTLPELAKGGEVKLHNWVNCTFVTIENITRESCDKEYYTLPTRSISGMVTVTVDAIKGLEQKIQMLEDELKAENNLMKASLCKLGEVQWC